MPIQVVGAGLGRTGTHSLKLALEELLGGPCYHMFEIMVNHPEHVDEWVRATNGADVDFNGFLAEYRATVDWPAAAFWRELADANPDAIVLLSVRDADAWWNSANETIFEVSRRPAPPDPAIAKQLAMATQMLSTRFTPDWSNESAAKAAYEAHNDAVRRGVPPDRLVEWSPGDGWAPICEALGLDVPSSPFPHVNRKDEFRAMTGLDQSSA